MGEKNGALGSTTEGRAEVEIGASKVDPALAAWLERYRQHHASYLARLDLRQREANTAFLAIAAMCALIAGLVSTMTLSGFLSHQAVLLVPGLSLVLATICVRVWVHDYRIEESRKYLTDTILPEMSKLVGDSLDASFCRTPEVSHGAIVNTANGENWPWVWPWLMDFFGRGISLVSVSALTSQFFTIMIMIETVTFAGDLDPKAWAKVVYYVVAAASWLLLMLVYVGYEPVRSQTGRTSRLPRRALYAIVITSALILAVVVVGQVARLQGA